MNGTQERWRAAAYEYRSYGLWLSQGRQFGCQGVKVKFNQMFLLDGNGEIAVAAVVRTKRNVNVGGLGMKPRDVLLTNVVLLVIPVHTAVNLNRWFESNPPLRGGFRDGVAVYFVSYRHFLSSRTRTMKLTGKVALVTGASAGIGWATALALAKEGADVALNYLGYDDSAKEAVELIRGIGRKTLLLPVDVSDQAAVENMVAQTVSEMGRIDVLVTCAVYSDEELFWEADMTGFRRTIDVTMWSPIRIACGRQSTDQTRARGQHCHRRFAACRSRGA